MNASSAPYFGELTNASRCLRGFLSFIRSVAIALSISALPAALSGCNSLYFASMEKLGYAKRDLMVSRIRDANETQKATKKQFENALEEFRSVVSVKGGDLEKNYYRLDRELKKSESVADELKTRVSRIEDVSDALFREWRKELSEYQNADLKQRSAAKLDHARERYDQMIAVMHRATERLDPALRPMKDNVLFLKHNLNAAAIGSLDRETTVVEENVDSLIRNLDHSISEAQAFIETIKD
ncbi:MAG: DUF2959 family protein [Bdellovibrionota bacterium]